MVCLDRLTCKEDRDSEAACMFNPLPVDQGPCFFSGELCITTEELYSQRIVKILYEVLRPG